MSIIETETVIEMFGTASFVIRNKTTKEVICEIFNKNLLFILNYEKYEAIPILQYLQEFNRKVKENRA